MMILHVEKGKMVSKMWNQANTENKEHQQQKAERPMVLHFVPIV